MNPPAGIPQAGAGGGRDLPARDVLCQPGAPGHEPSQRRKCSGKVFSRLEVGLRGKRLALSTRFTDRMLRSSVSRMRIELMQNNTSSLAGRGRVASVKTIACTA
ncbi:uncharacterized protein LOC144247677 [Lonchura striata]